MVYSALAVALMAGEPCLVPIYAQDKAVQAMTLTALYNLADQQSQKVRVSEVALQAASEGVAAAKSALLPSVDLSLQGSYTGNAFMLSRGFSTDGTTDYIVPGMGAIPVAMVSRTPPIGEIVSRLRCRRLCMPVALSVRASAWQNWAKNGRTRCGEEPPGGALLVDGLLS